MRENNRSQQADLIEDAFTDDADIFGALEDGVENLDDLGNADEALQGTLQDYFLENFFEYEMQYHQLNVLDCS